MNVLKKNNLFIILGATLFSAVIATVLSLFLPHNSGMIRGWNDAFFLFSTLTFCAGSTSALVSKSRRHYYRHLRDQYSGKTTDENEFEIEQDKRNKHAERAILVALGGITGILLSATALFR